MRRLMVCLACAVVVGPLASPACRAEEPITEKLNIPFKSWRDWPGGPKAIAPCPIYMAEYERYCMPGGSRAPAGEKVLKDRSCNEIIRYLNAHCGK